MLLNYLPAIVLVMGWCISRMTSPEASMVEHEISISKSFISSHGELRPHHRLQHHHHYQHRHPHHHHGRRHHRSRRQACQFPESLLTFLDESEVLPPLDVSSIEVENMEFEDIETDVRPSKSSAAQPSEMDGTETGSKSSQSKSETAGDALSETPMSDSRERRGKSRSKGHHSTTDHINSGNDQHDDRGGGGGGDGLRGKSHRTKNKNKSRLRRDSNAETVMIESLAEERKVQIRDWRGDIRRQFQSLGKSLTIERYLISEFKDGEVSKYRCISKVIDGEDGGFGDGKKHTYVVEKEGELIY